MEETIEGVEWLYNNFFIKKLKKILTVKRMFDINNSK